MASEHDPYAAGNEPDDVFVAPPTSPDDDDFDFAEPPGWPKVVGIVSIVFAALGLVCGGLGVAWMGFGPGVMQGAANNMQGGMPPALTTHNPVMLTLAIVGTLWSLLLLVGGVMCVNRKSVARPMLLIWSVGGAVLTVINIKFQLDMQAEIAQWVSDNPNADFSQQAGSGGLSNVLGLAIGVVMGLAWPAFCLIWFGLVKTKPEDMTGGVEDPAA